VPKPDITRLLIDTALQPELRRRMAEAPDLVFENYELSGEERDLLRNPDHRLLPLLGAALARREEVAADEAPRAERSVDPPEALLDIVVSAKAPAAPMLPDSLMALAVVPCLAHERIAFAAWISPMHEGADPSRLPPPAGASLPGQPLNPLHAVIQISSAQSKDEAGNLQVSMWASFRQASNAITPAPPETAGDPQASPFGSSLDSAEIREAAAAVRAAAAGDRYEKLAALTRALRGGDVR
jgi:hypothetical protein